MTLKEYLLECPEGEEITVWDKDYDIEVYFYGQSDDEAMMDLASKLNIVDIHNDGVTVDFSDLIERNIDNISGLFYYPDIDAIIGDMEAILAGGVSEDWFKEFVSCLR